MTDVAVATAPAGVAPAPSSLPVSDASLADRARLLAGGHAGARHSRPGEDVGALLASLRRTQMALVAAHGVIQEAARARRELAPAEEWLVENFQLVTAQFREITDQLPLGYLRELPILVDGPSAGLPRVYAVAADVVDASEARLVSSRLRNFIDAYQEVVPLTTGELWALPVMLRVCLIEEIGRLADAELVSRQERMRADSWADRLAARAHTRAADAVVVVAALAESEEQLTDAFVARLMRRLRDEEAPMGPAFAWIDEALAETGTSAEEAVRRELHRQSAAQVAVGNAITSLRMIDRLDWRIFFEQVSLVERALRTDPAGAYAEQDAATRDAYRHRVEELSRRSPSDELSIARAACSLAAGAEDRARHVGYYLVDDGMPALEAAVGYRLKPIERIRRAIRARPLPTYLGCIGLVVVLLVLGAVRLAAAAGAGTPMLVATALFALLPASEIAVSLVNLVVSYVCPPRRLPKLALLDGVPPELATAVVVPTIIGDQAGIARLVDELEVRYLANPDPHLSFGLLTDMPDAASATVDGDAELIEAARKGVSELNRRHGEGRFFLMHRRRRLNPKQSFGGVSPTTWMGWERKRGKLEQFLELIAGDAPEDVELLVGDVAVLRRVRYVVTLDSDTQAPRGSMRTLVGTIAHPLNRARIDEGTGRVTAGYGVIQPRVSTTLIAAGRSRFAHVLTGETGLDPYTTAVSDVYQDLFGEGQYYGKAILDPVAFRTTLSGRIPENRFLSHDLFEGAHMRTGLASDVELLDDFPASYLVYARRQHRWIRGDWQWLPWLMPRVPAPPSAPGEPEQRRPNDLSGLGRWRLFDNLRRSLVPPALVVWLACGWLVLPGSAPLWTALALSTVAFPIFAHVANALFRADVKAWTSYFRGFRADLPLNITRTVLAATLLADQGWIALDAVGRTLWRLWVTGRDLLEWETAAAAERRLGRLGNGPAPFVARMWPSSVLAVVLLAAVAAVRPAALPAAAPVALLWAAAPAVAWWLSRPLRRPVRALSTEDRWLFRRSARKTWRFFETFVTAQDNWLPPDNFQEDPREVLARRTSPSNIGLYLLSVLAARDLGYLTLGEVVERLEDTLEAIDRLEKHAGHLLNWYDTATLATLEPRYVSTVDSGNLVCHLVALAQGCDELARGPAVGPAAVEGLVDELELLREESDTRRHAELTGLLDVLCAAPPSDLTGWCDALERVLHHADVSGIEGAGRWGGAFVAHARALHDELAELATARDGAETRLEEIGSDRADELTRRLRSIATKARGFADAADFKLLYDPDAQLFSIGFNVATGEHDPSHYDLLASECRVASLWAIARDQVPQSHWFRLGRQLTRTGRGRAILSWSGTMFEYLMPALITRTYPQTLLDETYGAVLERQMAFAREKGVPWGISESAYNTVDLALNYRYRAFGVPGLGLQPGLGEDLVVAPYATFLAARLAPDTAAANLRALADEGLEGDYGYYESKDYTPARTPPGTHGVVVRCFMAHHQGMSLLAVDDMLNGDPMVRRFHADRRVRATELLLQERVPGHVPMVDLSAEDAGTEPLVTPSDDAWDERAVPLDGPIPGVQLLSNGTYSVFVTGAGGGLSRYRGTALTRWREDAALDSGGVHLYVRDAAMGRAWSTTFRPTLLPADECTATFSLDVGRFHRVDGGIETLTEVVVSPELPGEIRRLTLVNHGDRARTLDVTSFAEVALNDQAADLAHPAFGNLFVESRLDQQTGALLLGRRPRGPHEPRVWLAHAAVAIHGRWQPGGQHETSRARFLGRGRDASRPAAIEPGANLSGTTGSVLDPCVALRRRVTLGPGQRAAIAFVLAAGESSEEVLATAARLASPPGVARTFELAWTDARVELRHLGLVARQAHRFQDLAASLLFNDPDRRASSAVVAGNTRTQSALWAYGISGDNPIVLVRVDDDSTELVAEMLLAHEYWRANGLMADLVILSEHPGGYLQPVHDSLLRLVQGSVQAMSLDRPGGVFVRRGDQVAAEDSVLLDAVARVVLRTSKGRLARQLRRVGRPVGTPPSSALTAPRGAGQQPPALERLFWNGLGGFTPDGREYVIDLPPGANTPAPWVNVIANPSFGFVVTEAGTGFTWQGNSQSNRLTPWSNDPVADPSGEALYLRDEDSGRVWSPTPRPAPGDAWYRIRHGQGYSVFEHTSEEVAATCTVVAARDEPVKVWRVRLRNTSTRPRRLSATAYVEWVLGTTRERAAAYVVTQWDAEAGAVLARNRYADAAGRIAFLATSAAQVGFTGDRTDFLGRNGSHAVPAALRRRQTLTGHVGGGFDPCGAVQARLDLAPGEEREVVFLLGETDSPSSVRHLVATYGDPERAERAAEASRDGWEAILGTLEVHTPEPALDLLVNRWLLYQTLSCRLWGRSAFYQSGGAYGFRDQLQDALALLMAAPELAREQILRAAARQFAEGDVQHWWHPETGQGVRTHYSDDLLWLPYVTAAYVAATGDRAVLDVEVPFLELRELELEEHDLFAVPAVGASASLYEHCLRAVARGRTKGPHGLPLIGGGDWNDGMNRVGAAGRGESIWLAWFLARVELDVAVLCEERGDSGRARELRDDAQRLGRLVDEQAWDGGWYYRAYDDDGRPIGSHRNDECRIDAIAQSWAVLSGVGDPARARTALGAAETHLARGDDRLLLLLTPPFDRSDRDPGYIKGYPPGVRENGGQYTHGAIWGVWARAELRDGARAHELFGWLNPINHARTPEEVDRYKVEPYVVAADVYANPQHVGRGGWTWYTGSASWLYRLAVEALLGLRLHGGRLTVDPVLPSSWPGFTARLRRGGATYDIEIKNGPRDDGGAPTVELDGQPCPDGTVSLCDDGRSHRVVVVIGEPRAG